MKLPRYPVEDEPRRFCAESGAELETVPAPNSHHSRIVSEHDSRQLGTVSRVGRYWLSALLLLVPTLTVSCGLPIGIPMSPWPSGRISQLPTISESDPRLQQLP